MAEDVHLAYVWLPPKDCQVMKFIVAGQGWSFVDHRLHCNSVALQLVSRCPQVVCFGFVQDNHSRLKEMLWRCCVSCNVGAHCMPYRYGQADLKPS